ncbi:deoxyribodipyrimidine photo-lyase [Altererythrobacter atlanticus]|uniref:Deoxyribodipyrimidine photo-lyase n=1 Tax=Croceibacterium atlanticum TaxID=1267766 RepID=A0A0F7KP34_9SPHN|nr:deoxyribodipyrimidine photo-lyase [Croceibacterium atlanticum]AKH41349.1 Deoxyribodipyrimidine photo-lyase [Croceibacterium atlanticum]MBB5734137.1 deoxyribodipyrimidine photo-lyase [Croceibacterium atlanticum]
MSLPQIVWLRRDLRLADQPAFHAAAQAGPVIPVYVLDDDRPGDHAMGGASRWWLHHSLDALSRGLGRHHSRLILRRGDCVEQLCRIAAETGAGAIHAIRHYEPWWQEAERELAGKVDLSLQDGNYLMPPGAVRTGSGEAYKIFTPFYKALLQHMPPRDPLPEVSLSNPESWPESDDLADWGLLPAAPDWAGGMRKAWDVGEDAAHERLEFFLDHVADYEDDRNLPSLDGSSRLSPYLHFGELSPAQVWHEFDGRRGKGVESYRREIVWRDFAQNIICQFPDYPLRNYREQFDNFPWRDPDSDDDAAGDLRAWQTGRTGYPIVDAGMRQLWATGWMHNRVRMIAASFLIKHLLIDWRHGERWFWDTLVDADFGNNGTNWQWVSGTGVDSQMFVRIMAPLSQSEKFDAAAYIREWVPELADLPDEEIHDPEGLLRPADYAEKLIGHREARDRALSIHGDWKS